ncbi:MULTISPECIES: hypothetical protein [unclassified Pseudoalteromonas]|jgi:hypothetical protein|uniref:hypothetical protein n=1 Tax=unclassified Pseudoalteromonas TaxID=194690 RepID=UPI0025B421BA|nr:MULTISPECIES: hypothetical protein [unclassified Pseudoalteromonas]MDN3395151.1 hypothetical protein [Pseudoalteromonas sp. APC 3215]MDN3400077.1 hypothetical protein [Pseudoalteromonas sp. APC 3213]MDN3429344.1 hypothetical protein [Pseudoalteromonas sp. APC 3907]MDN3464419.1 hypothetical protein [Pseudoalteromonas sp. APC 3495]MDN3471087.1 hypothetical protein [Pseudoalteromonas sp. APC 4026]|tara:strand:+ start:1309 stop:1491 length:183 start_codon:yes stop_codon:yes gene_type:complete
MSTVTKSENTKLFREAEMLRKSIQSEIHSSVRNEPDNVETLNKKTSKAEELHNKPLKQDK